MMRFGIPNLSTASGRSHASAGRRVADATCTREGWLRLAAAGTRIRVTRRLRCNNRDVGGFWAVHRNHQEEQPDVVDSVERRLRVVVEQGEDDEREPQR